MPLRAHMRSLRYCIEFTLRCAGIVSFSSRIIAAWRAIETEGAGALFQDPLAETLAGKRAMQRARQRIEVSGQLLINSLLSTLCEMIVCRSMMPGMQNVQDSSGTDVMQGRECSRVAAPTPADSRSRLDIPAGAGQRAAGGRADSNWPHVPGWPCGNPHPVV